MKLLRGYHHPVEVFERTFTNGGVSIVSIDMSSECNYRCAWCTNRHLIGRDANKLRIPEYEAILKCAKEKGARTLVVPGTGEPTEDSDFLPLTDIAKELGYTTIVYSNITGGLDRERIEQLFENDVSLVVKLDSLDTKYFTDRYHAPRGTYELFFENFNHILDVYDGSTDTEEIGGNKYTIHRVAANMVLTLENVSEVEKVASLCNTHDLAFFCKPVKPSSWAADHRDTWRAIGNETGALGPSSVLVDTAKKYAMRPSSTSAQNGDCTIYRYGLTIKSNGDVQLCPDHHGSRGLLGNVRDVPLAQLIEAQNSVKKDKHCGCIMDMQAK